MQMRIILNTSFTRSAIDLTQVNSLSARPDKLCGVGKNGYQNQSSVFSPLTRLNSVKLCVTSIPLCAIAVPAINTS